MAGEKEAKLDVFEKRTRHLFSRIERKSKTRLWRDFEDMGKSVRVKAWDEFKRLAIEKEPKSIVFIISQGIPARDLTGLKLILPVEGAQYIFTDYAKDNRLRKTGIPIRSDKKGNRFIEDDDVKSFLRTQLQREDLQIFSYWPI